MAKKNYNKISTEAKTDGKIVDVAEEVAVETADNEMAPETSTGIVCNCKKLNLRKKADVSSKSIGILELNDEVGIIDDTDKTFYEVITNKGAHGYCMKKYIKIK